MTVGHAEETTGSAWRDLRLLPLRWSIGRTLLFLGLSFALQLTYQLGRDGALVRWWIDRATVAPSAVVISWLTPDERVVAHGHQLVSPHTRLSVLNGCEGTDVILLLVAAMFAFGTSWRRKLLGVVVGGLLVYLVNQVRIVALYYSLRFDRSLFEALHGYIAPIVLVAASGLFVLVWVSHAEPRRVG